MRDPVIQTQFDGVTRDGREIVIRVTIGDPHEVPSEHGDDALAGFYIELEPLMDRRRSVMPDSFGAMCMAIQWVRLALKIFVAHGGSVYHRGTRTPIDLTSPSFEPVGGFLRPEFLRPDPPPG